MSGSRETRRAALVMVAMVVLWGYSWVASKVALKHASALDFTAIRVELGIVTLLAAMLWTGRSFRPRHWQALLFIGCIQTAGFLVLKAWALTGGAPGKTSVLVFIMPFWVLLLAWPVLHERIHGLQWVAVVLAAMGLVLVLEPWALHASLFSNSLAILAGIFWAIGAVFAKRLHNRIQVDPLSFTFWQMLIGLVLILAAQAVAPSQPIAWNAEFVANALFCGALATGTGWLMWLYVLHRLPAGTTSLATLAVPVIAALASWLQLGEQPGSFELAGMLLIGLALTLLSWLSIRKHEIPEPMTGQE